MADTLIREGIAYASQPLSPVPQYWNGASYEKAQGIAGAIRVINYDSAGETFTDASPGSVTVVSSAGGTAVLNSGNPGIVEIISSAGGTVLLTNASPAFIEVILSAGGSAIFSNANPANIGILSSAGSSLLFAPLNPGHVELVSTSGSSTFIATNPGYISRSVFNRQLIFSGTKTFSSGATATSDLTYSITGSITATFTISNHEMFITNDGPYDITATVYKTISAGGTFNTDIGVSFLVPHITSNGTLTIGSKSAQIQGLFNVNQGLSIVLTLTAALTATVTTNLLIKELDL